MGNPGYSPDGEPGDETVEEDDLIGWRLRELYIQALASGVSDEQYSRMTLTKVLAHIEAEKHRRYWHARPIITAMLPHMDTKSLKALATGKGGKKDSYAGKAIAKMLEEYAPASALKGSTRGSVGLPIPDLPREAAEGLIEAFKRGLLSDQLWATISPWWPRIKATAKRGRRS